MARRRSTAPKPVDGKTPILPAALAVPPDGCAADEYREHWQRKRRWFAERGIDPGDWPALHAVLTA